MVLIKFNASQAHTIYQYRNINTKIMKYCANIYFNQQCLIRKLIPNYANIKITYTSPVSQVTLKKVHIIRIKDEIKFLYKKKQKMNRDLCYIHLKAAQEWGNMWYTILDSVHDTINQESEKKYRTVNTKLNQLSKTQTNNPSYQKQFYPHVVNNMDITFTKEELSLLNKGLKYNLGYKQKNWIQYKKLVVLIRLNSGMNGYNNILDFWHSMCI